MLYLLGRRLFDDLTGLWAAAFAAGSSALVEYSTNGRGYTMVVFFTALLLYQAVRISSPRRTRADWAVFCLAGAAGMFTIPVMLYPLAVAFLWIVIGTETAERIERKRLLLPLVFAGLAIVAATLLCYLPVIFKSGFSSLVSNRFVQPRTLSELAEALPGLPGEIYSYFHQHLPWPLKAILIAGFLAGIARLPRLTLATLVMTVSIVAVQRVIPDTRVFTFALVVYYLVAAAGIKWLIELAWRYAGRQPAIGWLPPLAWAVISIGIVYYQHVPETSTDRFPEAQKIADYAVRHWGRETCYISSIPANETILYYGTNRGNETFGLNIDPMDPPDLIHLVVNRRLDDLDSFLQKNRHRFLFFNPPRLITVVDSAEVYDAVSVLKEGIRPDAMIRSYTQQLKKSAWIETSEVKIARIAAFVLFRANEYDDAFELYRMLNQSDQKDPTYLNMLGIICYKKSDFDQARKYFLAQLELEPENASVLNFLGIIETSRHNFQQAEKYWMAGYKADTMEVEIQHNLGRFYSMTGRREQAEFWLLHALKTGSSQGGVYLDLAEHYAKDPNRQKQALALYYKAAELLPEQANSIRENNIKPLEAKLK